MERFAINILHKRIHKICRLCGVDQPHKIPIIDGAETIIVGDEEEEASLAKKIEECVGIQVSKDDKMPQNICSLCVDKINDFYEYRLMCAATNLQTRTILNLNLVEPTRKLLNFGELPKLEPPPPVKEEEKKDVKKVVEIATSSSSSISSSVVGKKGKKKRGPPSPSPSPGPTTRIKTAVDVKDEPVPVVPVKALTKKERLKQLQQEKEKDEKKLREKDEKKVKEKDEKKIKEKDDKKIKEKDAKKSKEDERKDRKEDKFKKEKVEEKPIEIVEQKHTRSKRKEPSPAKETVDKVEPTVPPPKKIKFEHPCSYCTDEFKTQTELDGHLGLKHVPMVRKFGCGSCRETFDTILESKDHNLWHQLTRTLYTCFKCKRKYDKNMALVKHMGLNACGRVARGRPPTLLPDIQCRLCHKKFKTQNLYEWHGCFLKPKSNCPKCGKYFVKKQILTRHYMMFCTGTLPPPEPVIVPKVEPVDPGEKAPSGTTTTANPERRTRRAAVVEPDLPKEEREIPFPPPLELAPETPAAPTPAPIVNKKKSNRKVTFQDTPPKPAPAVEANKFASLLDSGAKLDRDTDIATINNLLSSVTEAIASISEAKAKKKKRKKDKNKESAPTPVVESPKDIPNETPPPAVETPSPVVETPPPVVKTPPPVVDNRTAEEVQAYELAQEVGEMTLDQQLAFCAGKLPIVVLAKTTFKQECTEIDTEPSQLQEPMDEDEADSTVENGAEENNGYDNDETMDDYSGFQNEDDDEASAKEDDTAPSVSAEAPSEQEQHVEEQPFPMPIKQEIDPEPTEESEASEELEELEAPEEPSAPQPKQTAPPVEVPKELEKEPVFNEQLAINIKKEPGLEDDVQLIPAAKRKRPEPQSPAAVSPASSLSSSQSAVPSSPKPSLILKIKKEKGSLNPSVEPIKQIRTIVLDDDDDDDEVEIEKGISEPTSATSKKNLYKKPNSLAVRIKQEKVDPSYEQQHQIVASAAELPGGIRIKRERLDPDEEVAQPEQVGQAADVPHPPSKKPRIPDKDKPAPPIIAFDGVRIKREKPDVAESPIDRPSVVPPAEDPKPPEKKKKSKVKINPFALLRQKMAAEAAAKSAAAELVPPPQSPSPLPVITNVVGSASTPSTSASSNSSSGKNTPISESEKEPDRTVPVITQVTSMATGKASEPELAVVIKQEPIDEEENEQVEDNQQQTEDQADQVDDFPLPIKTELPEETDDPDESPEEEAEEPEFPRPIKQELDEESHQDKADESPEPSDKEEASEEPVDCGKEGEEEVLHQAKAVVNSEKDEQEKELSDTNENDDNARQMSPGAGNEAEEEDEDENGRHDQIDEQHTDNQSNGSVQKAVAESEEEEAEEEEEAPDQNDEEERNNQDKTVESEEEEAEEEEETLDQSVEKETDNQDDDLVEKVAAESEEEEAEEEEETPNQNDEGNVAQLKGVESEKDEEDEEASDENDDGDVDHHEDDSAQISIIDSEKAEQEVKEAESTFDEEDNEKSDQNDEEGTDHPDQNITNESEKEEQDEKLEQKETEKEEVKVLDQKESEKEDEDEALNENDGNEANFAQKSVEEFEKEEQDKALVQGEEETDYQEDEPAPQTPQRRDSSSPEETDRETDEVKEETALTDERRTADVEQIKEQQLENQPLSEAVEETENAASPISDVPMDEYDHNSQEPQDLVEPTDTEPSCTNNDTNATSAEPAPQSPDQSSSNNVEQSLSSEHHVAEQTTPLVEASSTVNPNIPLDSDLEELQNLLTEGLKPLPVDNYDPPHVPPDSSSSTAIGEQNMIPDSSTVSSVGNNAVLSGLDDDLESLLNNKIEEISDQFRQPAPPAEQSVADATAPEDELNLALERELLHEMIPIGTEMAPTPHSTASDHHSNNSLLEVEHNLLLEGTGTSHQQPS